MGREVFRMGKSVSFRNPICPGADPWMFTHDGWYYLCCTAGRVLRLRRAKDPTKIGEGEEQVIFAPAEGQMYSHNLWSPEIHYFSEEEFPGNAGWYLFIACDNGQNVNHRMYVLRSEDPDSPFAPYANPVSGERFVPEKFASPTDPDFNAGWCCGQTILRHGGKVYAMWVDEVGRQTEDFHQRIRLARLTNPYTALDTRVICKPTQAWEMHGYGKGADGKIRPRVVEGGTAVYGDDGKTYVIYSGSGYWTKYYALGQLTLAGDPEVYEDWIKEEEPIFSMSDSVFGCGHASYFKDAAGDRFICYHAYLSPDRTGGRYVFLERYTIRDGKVILGNGSGRPAPLTDLQTIACFD